MNIDTILQKGQSGESLNAKELAGLMSHAIYLLKYIESCTKKSISCANSMLEAQYKTSHAAALVGITMSAQDFQVFTMALNGTFTPNVALQNALNVARTMRRDSRLQH
jgi:hypothetical protein